MGAIVTVAVEGQPDQAVAQRLLAHVGLPEGPIHGLHGKGWLDHQLRGYNNAARFARWLVLRDLNGDAPCAPDLVHRLLPTPAAMMSFRVAVRSVEAWLLADYTRFGAFLGVNVNRIPQAPDALRDPKTFVVDLARGSRSRAIRDAIVPIARTTARVGPGYTDSLIQFVRRSWRPDIAAQRSGSLARCIEALRRWTA